MTQRRAYYCDHPGCDAYASRGFTAPRKPVRVNNATRLLILLRYAFI